MAKPKNKTPEVIILKEYYTDSKGKECPEPKGSNIVREFFKQDKLLKKITIPLVDLRYYTDIGDFDAGGTTVAKLEHELSACRTLLRVAGFKNHPSLQVMLKKIIADRDKYKELVEAELDNSVAAGMESNADESETEVTELPASEVEVLPEDLTEAI